MKSLHSLGAGTTWFGRQWPPGSKNYKNPSLEEIKKYIDYMVQTVPKNNRLVVDTARAYGLGESRIGEILDSERELNDKIFLCTKWGENWKINDLNNLSGAQRGTVDHSMDNLIASINFSQQNLKSFDQKMTK